MQNAIEAQKKWREVPVQQRARVLMKLHALLNEHKDEIAWSIVRCVPLFETGWMCSCLSTAATRSQFVILDLERMLRVRFLRFNLCLFPDRENGKTKPDADGDVFRGIEVVEHAIAMPSVRASTPPRYSTPCETHVPRTSGA